MTVLRLEAAIMKPISSTARMPKTTKSQVLLLGTVSASSLSSMMVVLVVSVRVSRVVVLLPPGVTTLTSAESARLTQLAQTARLSKAELLRQAAHIPVAK